MSNHAAVNMFNKYLTGSHFSTSLHKLTVGSTQVFRQSKTKILILLLFKFKT